ncbi:hypothetical protein GCM10025880_41780 [Methylorubrum aminovorans]|nr:hypothetical protein GCM10025880_41780 [Methylorubrum aminovorans]
MRAVVIEAQIGGRGGIRQRRGERIPGSAERRRAAAQDRGGTGLNRRRYRRSGGPARGGKSRVEGAERRVLMGAKAEEGGEEEQGRARQKREVAPARPDEAPEGMVPPLRRSIGRERASSVPTVTGPAAMPASARAARSGSSRPRLTTTCRTRSIRPGTSSLSTYQSLCTLSGLKGVVASSSCASTARIRGRAALGRLSERMKQRAGSSRTLAPTPA